MRGRLRGGPASRPPAPTTDTAAMMTKIIRQPPSEAIKLPSGAPTATAMVIPPVTMEIAVPRRSGEATATATAFAAGM